MLRCLMGSLLRAPSVKVAAPALQSQKRELGHVHPSLGKGLGILRGRRSIINGTRISRIPGMKNSGTWVSLGRMGTQTNIGTKRFAQHAEDPYITYRKNQYQRILGQDKAKVIINKLIIKKPRRPNSGKILCCSVSLRRPSIRTGEPVQTKFHAHIGVKSVPLREYSVVEVRPRHKRGITTKYQCKWGKYDFPAKAEASMKKRQYEGKQGY
ncbi:hypothetical protein DIPPA_25347 [Diplonema papillatum]|nr:hypothetical protein DIPPA_25347 [Diplonema papillatum]